MTSAHASVRCSILVFTDIPCSYALLIVAIKRDEGPHFQVTSSSVVCGEHFFPSDYYVPPGQSGREEDARLRLRPGVVPSQFTFRPKVQARPSPIDRRQAAALRVPACKATANQERFGPKTKLQTVEEELLEAKKRIGELETANTKLQAEVDDLRTQVFRFEIIKGEGAQLQFFTGLSKDMWSALWDFLNPRVRIFSVHLRLQQKPVAE